MREITDDPMAGRARVTFQVGCEAVEMGATNRKVFCGTGLSKDNNVVRAPNEVFTCDTRRRQFTDPQKVD